MAATVLKPEKQNLETYSLLWLDEEVNSSEENVEAQQQLRASINQLRIFEDDTECEKYIRLVSKDDRIVLIVSGRLGQVIVPRIHQLQQVFSIYVYCINKKKYKQWAQEFSKVRKVTVLLDELIQKIHSDQSQRQHNKIDEAFSISIFIAGAGEGQSTSEINGHFIHLQLLINCLVRMNTDASDRSEFISLCKKHLEGNNNELKVLEEFEHDYSSSSALCWYTRQSFLYRLLNKALRIQNVDLLFLFRFFIRDIERQLENNKCTSRIHVYRGQLISKDEVNALKNNVGDFISINSFLSTSLNRQLALFFLTGSDVTSNLQRVFFEIEADPKLENIKPFSNITLHSYFPDEEEVLFMIGSIFQLVHVDLNQDGIWMIRMKLCTGNDHQLKSLLEHIKNEHHDNENTLFSFCSTLLRMGKYNDAEKYCHRLIKELPSDHKYLPRCYHLLGNLCMNKDDLDSSFTWLNKSLEIKLRTLGSNDLEVADDYYSIGKTYRKKAELDRAIEMFEKALVI